MRKLLLTTAAVVICGIMAGGCAKTAGQRNASDIPDTVAVTHDTTVAATVDTAAAITPNAHDTLIDSRDGAKYATVTIGRQIWMIQNLNYKPMSGKSWCYDDQPDNCDKCGRLYDYETALKACPDGWWMANGDDWLELLHSGGGYWSTGGGPCCGDDSLYIRHDDNIGFGVFFDNSADGRSVRCIRHDVR